MVIEIITDERVINSWGWVFTGLIMVVSSLIVYIYANDKASEKKYRILKDASMREAFDGIKKEIAGIRTDMKEAVCEIKQDNKSLHEKVNNHEVRISKIEIRK
jgi:hypothetical protein